MDCITTETFPNIYAEYSRVVESRIRRYGIPARDVEDVLQDAWLLIWAQRNRQRAVTLAGFISVKSCDAARYYWRRRYKPDMSVDTVSIAEDVEYHEDQFETQSQSHVPSVPASQETTSIIRDVLDKMKPRHADVLWKQLERGVENEHPSGASQAVLHRARRRFRDIWHGVHQRRSTRNKASTSQA